MEIKSYPSTTQCTYNSPTLFISIVLFKPPTALANTALLLPGKMITRITEKPLRKVRCVMLARFLYGLLNDLYIEACVLRVVCRRLRWEWVHCEIKPVSINAFPINEINEDIISVLTALKMLLLLDFP